MRNLARFLPRVAMPLVRSVYSVVYEVKDRISPPQVEVPLPPARLRYRIGTIAAAGYAAAGERCARDIRTAAERNGADWGRLGRVLDFGCGTGRTLSWLRGSGPELHGSDRDEECVAWCRSSLTDVTFAINEPLPPLPFESGTFDVVYAISVFTHLDEQEQFAWLDELRRVIRPGGLALLSFHGPSLAGRVSGEDAGRLQRDGIVAVPVRGLWGLFPTYYNTYHLDSYVRERWQRFGEVREIVERGVNDHQDLAVLARS